MALVRGSRNRRINAYHEHHGEHIANGNGFFNLESVSASECQQVAIGSMRQGPVKCWCVSQMVQQLQEDRSRQLRLNFSGLSQEWQPRTMYQGSLPCVVYCGQTKWDQWFRLVDNTGWLLNYQVHDRDLWLPISGPWKSNSIMQVCRMGLTSRARRWS